MTLPNDHLKIETNFEPKPFEPEMRSIEQLCSKSNINGLETQ